MKLELFLRFAGVLQLGLLTAGASMSRVTDMRGQLAELTPFLQQLFWVYLGYIGFVLTAFGVLTLLNAEALAAGSTLARSVCVFIGLFWLGRLAVQFFVFDVRPYLTNVWLRLGYHATTVVFIYLTAVYAWAAWKGGAP
jgi:hypothetical protein